MLFAVHSLLWPFVNRDHFSPYELKTCVDWDKIECSKTGSKLFFHLLFLSNKCLCTAGSPSLLGCAN